MEIAEAFFWRIAMEISAVIEALWPQRPAARNKHYNTCVHDKDIKQSMWATEENHALLQIYMNSFSTPGE